MLADTEGIGNRTFDNVYFGGGTPSDLSAENLEQILSAVRSFNLSPDCEITLEGRISSLSENKIAVCRHFGVNRRGCFYCPEKFSSLEKVRNNRKLLIPLRCSEIISK